MCSSDLYVMTPMLSLPVNGRYGSVITTVGVQQSFYGTDTYSKIDSSEPKQDGEYQTIPSLQVDASSEMDRVFKLAPSMTPSKETVGDSRWTAVRHTVQPRMRYRNIPLKDQHENPRYDDGDRIRPINELAYSVTNILTRKREQVVAVKPEKDNKEPEAAVRGDYLDVVRLTLEQAYDIRESARTDKREAYERRPFSDIMAELEISFDEFVSFTSRSYWSPYLNAFSKHDHGISLNVPNWGSFYTGLGYRRSIHEYTREHADEIKTLTVSGALHLWGPWQTNFRYSHDYERSQNVDRVFELIYNHQCFQIAGVFSKDYYEEHYGIRIVLTGLGD